MKKIIIYSSKTGNTKKIAEAIHSLDREISIISVDEIKDLSLLENYDTIFLGGWIDRGTFDGKALNLAKEIKEKKVGYFFTLGAEPNSNHCSDCRENIESLLLSNGNEIVAKFWCQGAIDPKLIEWMSQLPIDHHMAPSQERRERWVRAASHPDEGDRVNVMRAFSEAVFS